jgi:lipopolysaccharide/colanic/teichoic acid biosynthesis glycosyltransferase
MYRFFFKRLIDVLVSAVLLIVASPLLLAVCLLLAVANHGHVFFFQKRPGLHGRLFRIAKMKTMTDECDADGNLLSDEERLTRVGRFVRSTSVDELPQLWNVLRGDMSLIGPRPLLPEYLPLYNEQQMRRHEVRPGITGWAQVHGRNNVSWQHKFELDVWYVDHLSFSVDMLILWKTFVDVLRRSDISADGEATVEPFHGND